jgi:hypothetical protein
VAVLVVLVAQLQLTFRVQVALVVVVVRRQVQDNSPVVQEPQIRGTPGVSLAIIILQPHIPVVEVVAQAK